MRFISLSLLGIALALAAPSTVSARDWPSRPVTMIVPFPAGGNADVIARAVASALGDTLGKQFVIENRGGAGGNLGGAAVAKAPADGYTLLFTTPAPVVLNKFIYKTMPYEPERDFAPVVLVAKSPLIVTAKLGFPAKTLPELIAYAKQNPGNVTVGHPGNGTLGHITSELVQQSAGVTMTNVPYRGSAPLLADLLGGQIDVAMDFMPTYAPQVHEGKVTALAVTTSQRTKELPNVPTAEEAGFRGVEATAWYAIVAPTGTPADIVAKVNKAVNAFLASENGKSILEKNAMQAAGGTPADLKTFIDGEIAKWKPVIEGAKIQM